jgi:hypothetical protein
LVFVLAVLYSHFIQFPPFDIPYNLYHRETLWSNTEKSGKEWKFDEIGDKSSSTEKPNPISV